MSVPRSAHRVASIRPHAQVSPGAPCWHCYDKMRGRWCLLGIRNWGLHTWICDAVNSATVLSDPKHEVKWVNMKIPTPDDKCNEMYADALWMRGSYYQNYSFAWSPLSNSSMGSFRLAWEIPLLGPKWHTRRHIWVFATLKVEGSNICLVFTFDDSLRVEHANWLNHEPVGAHLMANSRH